MASTVPFFGDAVHAVLPFMQAGGDPLSLDFNTFRDALDEHLPVIHRFNQSVYGRIFHCWRYVAEVVEYADEVWIEPEIPNGKRPDLVLTHRDRLYVLDIKTSYSTQHLRQSYERLETRRQVFGSASLLDRLLGGTMHVYGFVLLFSSAVKSPGEPSWQLLGEIAR